MRVTRLWVGLVFLAVGVFGILDATATVDASITIGGWWPLAIVGWALLEMAHQRRVPATRCGGGWPRFDGIHQVRGGGVGGCLVEGSAQRRQRVQRTVEPRRRDGVGISALPAAGVPMTGCRMATPPWPGRESPIKSRTPPPAGVGPLVLP